jgi:hypothetical protein
MPIHLGDDMPREITAIAPIRVSYHGKNHYNSVISPPEYAWRGLGERGTAVIRQYRKANF